MNHGPTRQVQPQLLVEHRLTRKVLRARKGERASHDPSRVGGGDRRTGSERRGARALDSLQREQAAGARRGVSSPGGRRVRAKRGSGRQPQARSPKQPLLRRLEAGSRRRATTETKARLIRSEPTQAGGACRRGQEDVRWRNLFGLRDALHVGIAYEFGDLVCRLVRQIQRCPDRSWRDGVHADSLGRTVLRQGLGERVDGTLRRGVVERSGTALQTRDRAGVDDRAAALEVWQGRGGRGARAMWKYP